MEKVCLGLILCLRDIRSLIFTVFVDRYLQVWYTYNSDFVKNIQIVIIVHRQIKLVLYSRESYIVQEKNILFSHCPHTGTLLMVKCDYEGF